MTTGTDTHRFTKPARRTKCVPPVPTVHASEAAGVAVADASRSSSLAVLLTGHILRDGEVVLMALKPSLWFIAFQSMRFAAVVVLSFFLARILGDRYNVVLISQRVLLRELAVFLVAGRVMYAMMQWMGRLYVLTDQRLIRLAGVFTIDVADLPLRKAAQADVTATIRERLVGCGSVVVTPKAADAPVHAWQTVAEPEEVHRRIQAAIGRAQSGGV